MTLTMQPDTVQIGRRAYPFTGYREASEAYRATIEAMGLGVSRTPPCLLIRDGRTVAHISYNGRIWPGDTWTPNATPIYDPRGA